MKYKIVVLGASGYIGGRLVGRLLKDGHSVRCIVRDPRKLAGREWPGVEIIKGDILERRAMAGGMEGFDVVYHLVHSVFAGGGQYKVIDQEGASIVKEASANAGIKRIIYLGSLGDRKSKLPPYHLSRNEVGDILRSGRVPVTEFRAAMIIGSGSASFDMMHALVNRLPFIMAPKFVNNVSQPISTRDTIRYLAGCLDVPESADKVIDIGGPDIISYREMMARLATQLDLKRKIIVLPLSISGFNPFWINLVTPIPTPLARMLIDGLQCRMTVENDTARKLFSLQLLSFDDTIRRSLKRIRESQVETKWSNASFTPSLDQDLEIDHIDILKNVQRLEVNVLPHQLFKIFTKIGGEHGWFFGDMLWRIRGFVDKLIGGVGLRRGRRHPENLIPGDALDFWRVESVDVGKRIVLRAEMKAPGIAWLEFSAVPYGESSSVFIQTARFYPHGLAGYAYWYALSPFHLILFKKMSKEIARRAQNEAAFSPRP